MKLIRIVLALGFLVCIALCGSAMLLNRPWLIAIAIVAAVAHVLALFVATSRAALLNELKAELGLY